MASLQKVAQDVAKLKVKEIPAYIRSRNIQQDVATQYQSFAERVKKQFDAGSGAPMRKFLIGMFAFNYLVSWPNNYRHTKAKAAGGHH